MTMEEPPVNAERRDDDLSSAVPARTGRREAWVGLFVLAGVVAVLITLFTLTDVSALRGRYTVSTTVQDAGGVRKGDPVQMRGVNIGRIRGFEMAPGGVQLQMELEGEYPVPADSRVVLRSLGLLGGTVAEVIPGNSPDLLERGGTLLGSTGGGGPLDVAEGLGSRADTVLTSVQALLSDQNVGAIGGSAAELQALLVQLSALAAEQRRELNALTGSLRRSAAGVEGAATRPELERAVARVDSITLRLDETTVSLDRAGTSLAAVLGRIERGEGTLGRLSADDSLYINLNRAATNLNGLVADIRREPKKYLSVSVF
jgi:phospholipid/cholesterol/gamma-HCH transport system substrate-binding protein